MVAITVGTHFLPGYPGTGIQYQASTYHHGRSVTRFGTTYLSCKSLVLVIDTRVNTTMVRRLVQL